MGNINLRGEDFSRTQELREDREGRSLSQRVWKEMPTAEREPARGLSNEPAFLDFAASDPFGKGADALARGTEAGVSNTPESALKTANAVEAGAKSGAGDVINIFANADGHAQKGSNGEAQADGKTGEQADGKDKGTTGKGDSNSDLTQQVQALSSQLQFLQQMLLQQQGGDKGDALSGLTGELKPLLDLVSKVGPLLMSII